MADRAPENRERDVPLDALVHVLDLDSRDEGRSIPLIPYLYKQVAGHRVEVPEHPEKLGKLLGFLQEHGWEKHEVVRKADRLSTLPQLLQDAAAGKGLNGWTASGWAAPEAKEVDPAQGGAPKSQQMTVVQGSAVGSKDT